MNYYIGVDGGGTKTFYALFDENKNIIDSCETRGSNHENLSGGFSEAAEIIWNGFSSLIRKNTLKPSMITGTLMGLAGIDHKFQHDEMFAKLKEKGVERFDVCNDGYIVIKAGAPDGVGIGLNLGTGTCCNSIDSRGEMLQLGGFGELSGDCGNGEWISERVFAAIYRDIVLGCHKTIMSDIFCKKAGISKTAEDIGKAVTVFDSPDLNKYRIYLTDTLFEAVEAGDGEADDIQSYMADRCSDLIAAHVRKMKFEPGKIHVVLSGSMLTKTKNDSFIKELLRNSEDKTQRRFDFIKLDKQPVTGCINWLLESKGA